MGLCPNACLQRSYAVILPAGHGWRTVYAMFSTQLIGCPAQHKKAGKVYAWQIYACSLS